MYFIHNKYDKASVEMMKTLPPDTVVIDLFTERDAGNYLDLMVSETPALVEKLEYVTQEVEPTPIPQTTDTELIMQAFSDQEIRDFAAQEERKILAQQMTDIELAVLGGGTTV